MRAEGLVVGIDATPLLGSRTGVGQFTASLINGLAERDDVHVTAFPLSWRGRADLAAEVPAGVATSTAPFPARLLRHLWLRSDRPRLDSFIGKPDVIHGPNFVVPPARAGRVATVHDLTCVRFPELCERDTLQYPTLIRRALASGAFVHTVSDAVRAEVLDTFGADPDRVVTVANGFTPQLGDPARGRRLAGVDSYVLAVGTVEPRKDLPNLVAALGRLGREHSDLTVVHVGGDGWGVDALVDAVSRLDDPARFRRLGPRQGGDLADLYAGARVFAYPSRYEGFGMPLLEAMSASVPVVSTEVPAIREVAGDAGLLVPVGDPDALADALVRAWTDDVWREDAVAAGLARTATFGWDRCVDGLVRLYRRAAEGASQHGVRT